MTARRSIVGLTVLCALVFSAFAAANASAAGTTQFTCVEGEKTQGFSDADCSVASTTGPFHHVAVAAGTTTELSSASTTSQVLTGTVAGISVEIKCTSESSGGKSTNKEVGGIMQVLGEGIVVTYKGCTVVKPAKKCVIPKETITTETLTSTTIEGTGATTTGIKFSPPSGKPYATIVFEGCETTSLNGTHPVEGTAVGTPKGALLGFTTESTENLTFAGQKAHLVGTITVSGRMESSEKFKPLSVTTTTP